MRKTALTLTSFLPALTAGELSRYADGWLLDGEIRQHSPQTLALRRLILSKFLWFVRGQECAQVGALEVRQFLAYLTRGHDEAGGRWGNAQNTRAVRPSTVQTYHRHLRTFFAWCVAEGALAASPMETIAAPIARPDQIQPFTDGQASALLCAARKSRHPKRDEAILLMLLDTGMRASELCSLKRGDLDMTARSCTVMGKGNKRRPVPFGPTVTKALWNYLREEAPANDAPLFRADRGNAAGDAMTRSGLFQLIGRLGKAARVDGARCSPHTFRHTFAVSFLRAGGNQFALMQMLGHTNIQMTARYVALAQADVASQHRSFSPVENMKRKK